MVVYIYIYEYMYTCIYINICIEKKIGIYIYLRCEGGLGSGKIWGATVDKWEGKIGAKFLSKVQMAPRKLR